MHKSKLVTAVIDCQTDDLTEAARFWSAALGRQADLSDDPATEKYVRVGSGNEELIVLLQKVPHASRVHLDIESDDIEAEVARLEALGAKRIEKDKDVVGDGSADRSPILRGSSAARWCDAGRCERMELMAG